MHRRSALLLFSLLFLTSSFCFGQGPLKKVLSGYIREEGSGHLITGARIELQNAMGTPIGSAYSDGNGAYQFDDIGGGDLLCFGATRWYDSFRQFVGRMARVMYTRMCSCGQRVLSQVQVHKPSF